MSDDILTWDPELADSLRGSVAAAGHWVRQIWPTALVALIDAEPRPLLLIRYEPSPMINLDDLYAAVPPDRTIMIRPGDSLRRVGDNIIASERLVGLDYGTPTAREGAEATVASKWRDPATNNQEES